MKHPLRSELWRLAAVSVLALAAALPAQEGKQPKSEPPKSEAQDPAKKGEQGESKDKAKQEEAKKAEKVTANDPAVRAIDEFIKKAGVDTKSSSWRTSLKAPPKVEFHADHDYFWHVETTAGPIVVRYFPDTAPMHVAAGIYLSRLGFYDGLIFHRIITRFMAQGGDPLGNGRGGPGFQMGGEFGGNRKHDRPGLLSMANAGPGTDGSQFFLTFVATPWLDGKHTIWGEVVEGMDTLRELEKLGSQGGQVANPPKMVRTSIRVKPKPKADGDAAGADKQGDDKQGDEKKGEGKGDRSGR